VIITVTPNPAVDVTHRVAELRGGEVHPGAGPQVQ
jgi:fructose-1-phosphate kinase PfkB-like protein